MDKPKDSGYRPDGGTGSPMDSKITCGELCFIPNTGKMAKPILDEKGQPTGRYAHVNIRYIKGCPFLEVEEQRKAGYNPSPIKENDAIVLKKGVGMVKNEGDTAYFEYLAKVYYNQDAPNRPKTAPALFRVVKKEKKISDGNELEFSRAEAISWVSKLVKKEGKEYTYNEAKIDNAINVLSLASIGTYSEKVGVLTAHAKQRPLEFLQTVTKLEDLAVTEISHALQLDVFRFAGNSAEYVEDKEVIAHLGEGQMKQTAKISKLAEILRTPEYASQYEKFKIKLEIAQENSIKN